MKDKSNIKMKDSGIPWVGKVPTEWEIKANKYVMHKIKEIKDIYENEDILSLSVDGVKVRDLDAGGKMPTTFDGYQKLYKNNLLMCLFDYDVTPCCIGLIQYEGLTSPAYSQFVMNNNNSEKYYYYYYLLLDFTKELVHLSKNLRHSFTETELGQIKVPVPPVEEQKRIANFLDEKCSKIDKIINDINKQIETLENYKKSKIKEIFDYYLSNNKFVFGKLRYLSKLITKQTGFDYTNTIQPSLVGSGIDNTIPYLQTRHFKDNNFNLETEYYIPLEIANKFPNILLNKKCLLFSIVGASIGNVAVYNEKQISFLGGAICKVDLIDNRLYEYVKHYMMSYYGQNNIVININSSAQGTITVENVRNFKIPIFDNYKLYIIVSDIITNLSKKINKVVADKKSQIESLEKYKKSLIFEYVTGKKQV